MTTNACFFFHNIVVNYTTMDILNTLAAIAIDLTADMKAEDRYHRLLTALHRAIPYDAATLLQVEQDRLVPIAARGLTPDAMGRTYRRQEHPRLDVICSAEEPVLFSRDSPLPDPFDGMLADDPGGQHHIHACLGCPLYLNDRLIGILTADALDAGAFDHLPQHYLKTVSAIAAAQMQLASLLTALEEKAERQGLIVSDLMQDRSLQSGSEIIGRSEAIAHLRREIELCATSDFTILIQGETGVGKELVARAIHLHSRRRDQAMLYLNCAALPESLAESELFGHVKGAFTGATQDRSGKFELAHEGTLFLDEIGELSLPVQAKILRTIQNGEVQRIGSAKTSRVDVRLLAATNRDLAAEVEAGRFRLDLYHRLNVYPVRVPPLRERKEDIPLLAGHFIDRTRRKLGLGEVRITPEALRLLTRYSWPGNVRELENIIARAVLKASQQEAKPQHPVQIAPAHLAGDIGSAMYVQPAELPSTKRSGTSKLSLREEVRLFQIKLIEDALTKHNGNWAAAARDLQMNRSNLHHLATRLGIRHKQLTGVAADTLQPGG